MKRNYERLSICVYHRNASRDQGMRCEVDWTASQRKASPSRAVTTPRHLIPGVLPILISTGLAVLSSKHGTNFRRLVLGCMDSYDSEQRRILQHFSRSARFAAFCTTLISKLFQNFTNLRQNFVDFCWNYAKIQQNFAKIRENPEIFAKIIAKNLQILSLERCKRMQIL